MAGRRNKKPPATTHCLSLALPSNRLLLLLLLPLPPVAAFPATLRLPIVANRHGHASLAQSCGMQHIYRQMPSSAAPQLEMLLLLLMITAVAGGYDRSVNYWQAFAPGKLLQRLDALTLAGEQPVQASQATDATAAVPTAQAKLDLGYDTEHVDTDTYVDVDAEVDAAGDVDDVELQADSHSAEGHSGEDYERNYEQFVRQYFDRAADDHDVDVDVDVDDHDDDAAAADEVELDGSLETQAEASNVDHKQKHRDQRCRRVRRNGQLCKICREPRNNEVSETCSYSHEAEPEQYAYGSGTQYKRYRDEPQSEEESVEQGTTPSPKRKHRSERQISSQPTAGNSLCVRQLQGNSVCYECKDSGGQRMSRCYDAALTTHSKSSAKPGQPRTQQSEQEQRIYKRTISYSYAQGSRGQDGATTTQPTPVLTNVTHLTPNRRRKLTKIVRRRAAVPNKVG